MAASMLRWAAASALRRRSPLSRGFPSAAPFQPRGLRPSAAVWPLLPPSAAAAGTGALRHLNTAANKGTMESERRKAVDEAKAELLRHLMRGDAADGGSKMTEELVGFLRRQIPHDDPPASSAGDGSDKHLLLTLLVRSARAEEKLSKDARRAELVKRI